MFLKRQPGLEILNGAVHDVFRPLNDFEERLNYRIFNAKDRKAINLTVSQVNQCNYCLMSHFLIAGIKNTFISPVCWR